MECNPMCIYFPAVEKVVKEEIIDGVKHRYVIRRCGFDTYPIRTWDECHRPDGPLTK